MAAFEELGVIDELAVAVNEMGWELPTPIQSEAIPAILGGSDVLIAAETGSGKTGAFSLPIGQIVWERRKAALQPSVKSVQKEWKLNVVDRDAGLAVDTSGLFCESRAPKAWHGSRCYGGVHSSGKYYFEARIEKDGLCRVGWATLNSTLNIGNFLPHLYALGTDDKSYGFGGTGKKSFCRRFEDYGESFTSNDVLGCYLDLDNLCIWWSKNGREFPVAYKLAPLFRDPANALHPAIVVQTSALTLNFGDQTFAFPPKGGFVGVAQARENCQSWNLTSVKAHSNNTPLCVVLEPTRELVEQTHNNIVKFSQHLVNPPIRARVVMAGMSVKAILDEFEGTPARIVDLIESNTVSIHNLQFIVVDEADHILADKQSASILERIIAKLPLIAADGSRIQKIVCSATLHNMNIDRFANRFMQFPQWIDLKGMDNVAETVHHVVCPVDADADKMWIRIRHSPNCLEDDLVHRDDNIKPGTQDLETLSLGTKILKGIYTLKAIEALNMNQAIIFCRTKQQCDQLEFYLNNNKKPSVCLHGDRSPQERSQALKDFKENKIPFLICTDVAARGIDVAGVPFVINVTLPDDKAVYVHRIGRVGRAERMGLSISLVSVHEEKVWYHTCRSKGRGCFNTQDVKKGGCTIWYNEQKLLADIEEHLGVTISQVDSSFKIPVDEFDGKIVYGAKKTQSAAIEGHTRSIPRSVAQLADLERKLQLEFIKKMSETFALIAKNVK